jgi:hypothetical protein
VSVYWKRHISKKFGELFLVHFNAIKTLIPSKAKMHSMATTADVIRAVLINRDEEKFES